MLQIDELKGTKPTEKIDLSGGLRGVASAILIASCIKENRVLKELRCAAARVIAFVSVPIDTPALTVSHTYCSSLSQSPRQRSQQPGPAGPQGRHRQRRHDLLLASG